MKKRSIFEEDEEENEENEDSNEEEDEESDEFDERDPSYRKLFDKEDSDDEENENDEEDNDEAEEDGSEELPKDYTIGEIELPWLKSMEGEEKEIEEDPKVINERIKELVNALSEKKSQRTQPRSDLMEQLLRDCCAYYGYLRDLIDIFSSLFSPAELISFLEANSTERPVVIRVNTIKTKRRAVAQALIDRGVSLEPLADWSDVGLKIFESSVPIGATPEYLAGHYMLQSASSFAPVIALDPQPGERILDMCAAPGGKTTYICQLMQNTGLVVANDAKKPRIAALMSNISRLGIRNCIVVNHDGRDFPKVMGGFNRILLDAPCSGLGVISRDPSVKMTRTMHDITVTAQLQRELLLSAVDSTQVGGIIVYSTCSITVEENERVVQYCLDNRFVRLVNPGFEFGKPGLKRYKGFLFDDNMTQCRRLYPHQHNMDGFFIAKLEKLGNGPRNDGNVVAAATAKVEANGKTKKMPRVQQIGTKKKKMENKIVSKKSIDKKFGDKKAKFPTKSKNGTEKKRKLKEVNGNGNSKVKKGRDNQKETKKRKI